MIAKFQNFIFILSSDSRNMTGNLLWHLDFDEGGKVYVLLILQYWSNSKIHFECSSSAEPLIRA